MMIRPLPPKVSDLILSGASISSQAAALEILLLNSIDAGASQIDIDCDAKQFYFRIRDNGRGIPLSVIKVIGEQMLTNLHRQMSHHPSTPMVDSLLSYQPMSISNPSLNSLIHQSIEEKHSRSTFGHQGLSCYLLSQVAVLTIFSTSPETLTVYKKTLDASNRISRLEKASIDQAGVFGSSVSAQSPGTEVIATELFQQYPVRRRQMEDHPERELKWLIQIVIELALTHPFIRLKLMNSSIYSLLNLETHVDFDKKPNSCDRTSTRNQAFLKRFLQLFPEYSRYQDENLVQWIDHEKSGGENEVEKIHIHGFVIQPQWTDLDEVIDPNMRYQTKMGQNLIFGHRLVKSRSLMLKIQIEWKKLIYKLNKLTRCNRNSPLVYVLEFECSTEMYEILPALSNDRLNLSLKKKNLFESMIEEIFTKWSITQKCVLKKSNHHGLQEITVLPSRSIPMEKELEKGIVERCWINKSITKATSSSSIFSNRLSMATKPFNLFENYQKIVPELGEAYEGNKQLKTLSLSDVTFNPIQDIASIFPSPCSQPSQSFNTDSIHHPMNNRILLGFIKPMDRSNRIARKEDLIHMVFLAQCDNKFILAKRGTTLYAFDQHAVHERIRYEGLLNLHFPLPPNNQQREKLSSKIYCESCHEMSELTILEYQTLASHQPIANDYGWKFHLVQRQSPRIQNQHSPMSIVLEMVPVILGQPMTMSYLKSYIHELMKKDGVKGIRQPPTCIINRLKSKACRGAIMFGDRITRTQGQELLFELSKCDFPFACAHGRPNVVTIGDLKPRKSLESRDGCDELERQSSHHYQKTSINVTIPSVL